MSDSDSLKRIIKREREARKQAEQVIEEKSRELYDLNQSLIKLNNSLEEKVQARTQQLEASNQELILAKEKAMASTKAKSEFLSTMSHEIRTPLNAIVGLTNILRQQAVEGKPVELVEIIKYSADSLLMLINDILDLSAIESGKITFEKVNFDLLDLCKRLKHTFKHKAEEKGLRLALTMDDDIPPNVIGDPTKLNQILTNLMSNAMKFTEEGKVQLVIELMSLNEDDMVVQFKVKDTGIGIAQDKLDLVFEKFRQAESSTKRKYGGTGLGLAISKELAELQGGSLTATSEPGVGTTFILELPLKVGEKPKQETVVSSGREVSASLEGLRVLLAEDIELNQYLMREVMRPWNVHLVIAENGLQVLEALEKETFDLLLLDMHMPEMDGIETAESIRAGKVGQNSIPIVGLTADVFTDTREAMMAAGVDRFLTKPLNADELLSALIKMAEQDAT